jgi:hypothetical protein
MLEKFSLLHGLLKYTIFVLSQYLNRYKIAFLFLLLKYLAITLLL